MIKRNEKIEYVKSINEFDKEFLEGEMRYEECEWKKKGGPDGIESEIL